MNHRRGGDFLIRCTAQLGARLPERRISRMRVQVGDIRAHRLLNRRGAVTFHALTRRIGTTPRYFMPNRLLLLRADLEVPQPLFPPPPSSHHASGWDNVDAAPAALFHGMRRVLPDGAHFIALRDIFLHTRAFGAATSGSVAVFEDQPVHGPR
ncbi:hypothetical protein KCP73_13485 [Salmonella enterica subsp. enterica]|nr:hypothetical protein KCP73_13485 [Salmonella enterica subsp. enterica]